MYVSRPFMTLRSKFFDEPVLNAHLSSHDVVSYQHSHRNHH